MRPDFTIFTASSPPRSPTRLRWEGAFTAVAGGLVTLVAGAMLAVAVGAVDLPSLLSRLGGRVVGAPAPGPMAPAAVILCAYLTTLGGAVTLLGAVQWWRGRQSRVLLRLVLGLLAVLMVAGFIASGLLGRHVGQLNG